MSKLVSLPATVSVRTVTEADAEAFRELRIEALRTAPTAFGSDVASAEQISLANWQQRMRNQDGTGSDVMFVAEAGERLVAMTLFSQEIASKMQHQAHIYSVYVQPAFRGQGLIDQMFRAGFAWAYRRGLRMVKLSVTATNTPAVRVYTRLGFSIYGVEPELLFWEGTYYDELLMYRRITSADAE